MCSGIKEEGKDHHSVKWASLQKQVKKAYRDVGNALSTARNHQLLLEEKRE